LAENLADASPGLLAGRALLSVLVLAFSFSGVQQLGAPFYIQYFFNGGILIVAVGLSVYAARRRQRAATTDRSIKA
jgi:ribose transport system permease protein